MKKIKSFTDPIYVTRPLLPDLNEFSERLTEVWTSRWLTNSGPQHGLLEKKLSGVLKVPNLALFNNGTIALMVACKALGLKGEVITTSFTFPATPHALTWNNIVPVFCDIEPVTMNIDADKIEAMITPQTTAILAVHVFGTPCDTAKIQKIADRRGLKVIYDAAHAFGVEIDGQGIGTFGDISMFSFHATKLFHTAEGGALTFNNVELKTTIEMLRNFGITYCGDDMDIPVPGLNGKMNELEAAMGLALLGVLAREQQKRRLLRENYQECLKNEEGISVLPVESAGLTMSYQYLVVRINERLFGCSRDSVFRRFKDYNVFPRRYFYPLCSDYACYRALPSSLPSLLPVARTVSSEVLALPFYGGLTSDDVERICTILKSFRGKRA